MHNDLYICPHLFFGEILYSPQFFSIREKNFKWNEALDIIKKNFFPQVRLTLSNDMPEFIGKGPTKQKAKLNAATQVRN